MASEIESVIGTRGLREVIASAVAAVAPAAQTETGALVVELQQLRLVGGRQADAVTENTRAVLDNTVAQASGLRAAAGSAGKTAVGLVTAGLSPLISGLVKLFTGGDKHEPAPTLATYTRPQPLAIEGEVTRERTVEWRWPEELRRAPAVAPQVTVQVQAIDSRSFLDRKDDIARAVREAVLNSHSLVDALEEL